MNFEIERTDEEREELVKQWIKDYWLFVLGAVGLAVACVYGLSYFRQSSVNALGDRAEQVEQVKKDLLANNINEATQMTAKIQGEEQNSSFSALTTLTLAKKLFDEGQYDEAIKQYDWLISHAGDVAMRDLGRLRKARALASAEKYTIAADTLAGLEGQENREEANLLKGDILMAAGSFDEASKAYESVNAEGDGDQLVQQRLDLLKIKQQAAQ